MERGRWDNLLASGINWAYWGLLFFLPLLMWTRASEVFEFPKMLFVYAMTVVIGAMWLGRMVINRKILINRTPLDIPILLFLISQIISTLVSIEPHISWWGYYGRFNGGLWSTICYTLLYYAFTSNNVFSENSDNSEDQKIRKSGFLSLPSFLNAVLFSALIVSSYAILQHFGIDKDFWVQDVVSRVFSTQGQPNWLAGYAVLILPLILFIKNKYRYFLGGLLLLALFFTKSKSGLIGLGVEIAIMGLIVFFNKIRKFIWAIGIAGVIVIILASKGSASWRTFRAENVNHPPSPKATEGQGGTDSGKIRIIVWKGAGELIKRYPLFGTGPETFAYTYWWVRPAEHNYTSEWNFLYNKAHNEWLNLAANTGLFGLGSHLLLLGWFTAWSLSSPHRQGSMKIDSGSAPGMTVAAILAAVWGVEAVNFLGFSTVTTQTYAYLFMAMAVITMQNAKCKMQNYARCGSLRSSEPYLWQIEMIGVIGIIGGYFLIQIFIMFIADLGYNRGKQYAKAGYIDEAVPILENVVNLVPNEPVFREELAEAQTLADAQLALENFEIVRRQNPDNVPVLRRQAQMIFAMGEVNNLLYERGIELMLHSIKLAPTDPRGYYGLGVLYEQLGEEEKAKENYQKALTLKNDYAEAKAKLEGK